MWPQVSAEEVRLSDTTDRAGGDRPVAGPGDEEVTPGVRRPVQAGSPAAQGPEGEGHMIAVLLPFLFHLHPSFLCSFFHISSSSFFFPSLLFHSSYFLSLPPFSKFFFFPLFFFGVSVFYFCFLPFSSIIFCLSLLHFSSSLHHFFHLLFLHGHPLLLFLFLFLFCLLPFLHPPFLVFSCFSSLSTAFFFSSFSLFSFFIVLLLLLFLSILIYSLPPPVTKCSMTATFLFLLSVFYQICPEGGANVLFSKFSWFRVPVSQLHIVQKFRKHLPVFRRNPQF